MPNTYQRDYNKYELTATLCLNWPKWFAISSFPAIYSPSFGFMGEVVKKKITKLGCEKSFCRVKY
jgi:hypothetical protein